MKYVTNFFRVGCVALLAMLIMAPGASAQQYSPPDPPTDLAAAATDGTAGTITLSWSPVADVNNGGLPLLTGIAGYRLEVSDDAEATWTDVDLTGTTVGDKYSFNHDLTALTPNHNITRHYRIYAINGEGEGDPSGVVSATTHNVPDPPTDLAATTTAGAAASIDISWSPVAEENNGGLEITSYVFETSTDGDSWTALTPVAPTETETKYTYTDTGTGEGWEPGSTHQYRVKAVNGASADGGEYASISATTHNVPGPPTGLKAVVTANADTETSSDIALSWTAPANNGGLDISGYQVETSTDNGLNWSDLAASNATLTYTQSAQTVADPIVTHLYRVSAINSAGTGARSDLIGVKLAPPAPPTELNAVAVNGQKAIDLFWTAPENDGEPALTGYRIERSTDYDATNPTAATWTELATNYTRTAYRDGTETELTDGTEYYYRVRALNGVSVNSSAVGGNPSDVASAVSSNKAGAPTNLSATVAGDMSEITLAWDGPAEDGGSTITGYKIEVSSDAGAKWETLEEEELVADLISPGTQKLYTYTHSPVVSGTTYIYRVSAVNDAGPGAASAPSAPVSIDAVVPGAPTKLVATPAVASIALAWEAPEMTGGSAITGYKIEVSSDAGANWTDLEDNTGNVDVKYTHTGLDNKATRHYRVSAINSAGTGAASDVANATTHDVPGAITDLAAEAAADAGEITLTWTAPADGGDAITGYKIEVSDDAEATWEDLVANTGDVNLTYTHKGLARGETRHYRVSAINGAGTGAASNVANATTSAAVPGAPTGLTASSEGGEIKLSWTAPAENGGSAITGYKIEVSTDAGKTWEDLVANTGSTDVTHTDDKAGEGETRHYRVSAINSTGTGAPSNVANATIGAQHRYAVSSGGGGSGDCIDPTNPCTLEAALRAAGGANDTVLVRIRRVGETATIGDAITIGKTVTLGVYVRGGGAAAKGAVSFTGSVKLTDEGSLMTHKNVSVHFDEIEVAGTPSIDKLVVRKDLTIAEDDPDNTMTSVLAVDELTVNSGQTLTIGEGADVRVRLKKGAPGKMIGKFEVKGTIDGGGDLWIAHTSDERDASGFMLHEPGDYDPDKAIPPSKDKFTADDCLMVTGGGTVENDLYAVAAGNVCVGLEEIGNLVAVGSVGGTEDITTDVIFRSAVTVNGDVQQWNDARVLFEMDATIEGDVALDYGDAGVGAMFGTPNSDPDDFERATGSGVEFAGASNTIEGDLDLKSGSSTQALFSIGSSGNRMSTVEGDLIIEDSGGIHLGGEPGDTKNAKDNPRAHNLSVEGDVFVYADAEIMMGSAAKSTIEADVCSAPGLGDGNKVMLSGDVVFAEGTTLTIPAVVVADDVEVEEEGTLKATTVHITEDGELDSDGNVEVEDALVLQGDGLEGSLADDSTVDNLTYATVDSDEIDLGDSVMNLSVNVGEGKELRISESIRVTNLGLCSGALVLIDTDTDGETLKVTDLLTVADGTLSLDSNRPGSTGTDVTKPNAAKDDGYILKYVTAGERTVGLEWFAPRKVAVDHKDAVIIVDEAKSLVEGVHIFKGHLHLKGDDSDLTIGMPSSVSGIDPFVMVDNGELHSNGNNVMVHGTVKVATGDKQVGKIITGGGELHVLGQNPKGIYTNGSAEAEVGVEGTIDVGMGALQLGPVFTAAVNGLAGGNRPDVRLTVSKTDKAAGTVTGKVFVPRGSKETFITGEAFDTVVLDGAGNPKKDAKGADNWGGGLYFHDTKVVIDSLAAMNDAAVEFYDQGDVNADGYAITITKDVELNSARIYVNQNNSLKFGGDLTFGETGGMRVWDKSSVTVMGDFMQNKGSQHGGHQDGTGLAGTNTLTVMGDFMVADGAHRFETNANTSIVLKGDFHFGAVKVGSDKMLNADLEFSGKEAQAVGSASKVDLGNVLVNNSAGLVLSDSVSQGASSTLTLTDGVISSDMNSTWTVKNPNIEEDVRGRNNALTTCDSDENCANVITGGSRRSNVAAGISRHVVHGNSGGGEPSGGYLFPVGGMDGDRVHYRPLVLQLADDLSEAMPVTVTPVMASEDMMPSWPADNIVVHTQDGSLTLDAHADIFWKVEFKDAPDQNPHIRIAAGGLVNVFDDSRLRIVQWDCDWSNATLAGMQIDATDEESFAENGYVNGVLNLTQQSVEIGKCAILGVAANGVENPIHRDEITGGLAEVQFIHNAVIPVPVDVSLDGAPLLSGLTFQSATGYTMVSAGSHQVRLQPAGAPAGQAINVELPTLQADKSYAVIAHGTLVNNAVKTIETRKMSTATNMVEAILVHGSGDAAEVNVNLLDPYNSNQLDRIVTKELAFDQTTRYLQFEPDFVNLQVTGKDNMETVVFQLDLSGRQGEALILNLSNMAAALEVYGVDVNGNRVNSFVVTNVVDAEELPTEFTLHGNYPNPFNPSTRIQFDLPETAQVSLQIVDMLGREVMTLPAKEFEAGANRSIELNAINLASGTYLYRMIATGAESRYVKTGRMTLVK